MNEKDTPSLEWEEWNGKLPSPELGRAGGGGGLTESEARVSVRARRCTRACTRAWCGLGPAPAAAASVPSPLVSGSPRAQPGLLEGSATDPGTEEVGKNI